MTTQKEIELATHRVFDAICFEALKLDNWKECETFLSQIKEKIEHLEKRIGEAKQ